MRIGLFTACYKPTINGVVYHLEELKNELEKMNHQVFVFAPETQNYQDKEKNIIRYPSLPNPKVKSYPLGLPFLTSKRKIRQLDLDIIHSHHPFPVGDFAAVIAKQLNKPLVFTHHTQYALYVKYYLSARLEKVAPIIINLWMESFLRKCQAIICPTKAIAKQIKQGFPKAKTVIIPNGINTNLFSPSKSKKKKQIIYVGRVDKEKGIDQLIKTFQDIGQTLPKYKLVVVGDGNYLEKAQKLTHRLKLSQNILFLGPKKREKLPKLLNESFLFLTLSETEVMPLAILEAAACGLPVIAPKLPSFEEVFWHQKGTILVNRFSDFGPTVTSLLKNDKKLKKLSSEARQVGLKFSSQKTTRQVVKLYQSLLATIAS